MISLPEHSENIDVNWGLNRVEGNRDLFNYLLKGFHQDHHNDIKLLQHAFNTNKLENAQHIIHTIKGIAANIGAHKVQQHSATLEQCIVSGQDYSVALETFIHEFTDLMTELKQYDTKKYSNQMDD